MVPEGVAATLEIVGGAAAAHGALVILRRSGAARRSFADPWPEKSHPARGDVTRLVGAGAARELETAAREDQRRKDSVPSGSSELGSEPSEPLLLPFELRLSCGGLSGPVEPAVDRAAHAVLLARARQRRNRCAVLLLTCFSSRHACI